MQSTFQKQTSGILAQREFWKREWEIWVYGEHGLAERLGMVLLSFFTNGARHGDGTCMGVL